LGEVIISDANEFDLPQIYEIERTSFPTPYPEGLLRAYLFIAEGLYLVAREDGQIKGYCIGVIHTGIGATSSQSPRRWTQGEKE
jgi:SSU ribosomal protein S18P alanine acetyltransferase (EC 2.3.1.-)